MLILEAVMFTQECRIDIGEGMPLHFSYSKNSPSNETRNTKYMPHRKLIFAQYY